MLGWIFENDIMITMDRMYCTMIANNADVSIVLPVIHIEKKEMDNVVFKRTLLRLCWLYNFSSFNLILNQKVPVDFVDSNEWRLKACSCTEYSGKTIQKRNPTFDWIQYTVGVHCVQCTYNTYDRWCKKLILKKRLIDLKFFFFSIKTRLLFLSDHRDWLLSFYNLQKYLEPIFKYFNPFKCI